MASVANVFIGDLRAEQLKNYYNRVLANEVEDDEAVQENIFITDPAADYTWFINNAINVLAGNEPTALSVNIFLMLGLQDCLNNILWDDGSHTALASSAEQYVQEFNKVVTAYEEYSTRFTFYVCTVGPVNGDYFSSYCKNSKISANDLNNTITKFNAKLLAGDCTAEIIDCYKYLTDSGFESFDGIRYTTDVCRDLYKFIINSSDTAGLGFVERTTMPIFAIEGTDRVPHDSMFWINEKKTGGNSPFDISQKDSKLKAKGCVLPSTSAYAWGRFYEILGARPTLSTGAPSSWYDNTDDGYLRGDEPQVGAVACWKKAGTSEDLEDGYVAIVEKVENGYITISASSAKSNRFWYTGKLRNDDRHWGFDREYSFQGFIYNPAVTETPNSKINDVKKTDVHTTKGALSRAKMETNALYICKYFLDKGWTMNAIAGILGNLEHESWINPGVTELGGSGFGLVQWTPPTKFTNWCDKQSPKLAHDDVDSQLARIEWERTNNQQYSAITSSTWDPYWYHYKPVFGPTSFNEFATSTDTPFNLACAFLYNYEKPSSILYGATPRYSNDKIVESAESVGRKKTQEERDETRAAVRKERGDAANSWYEFLCPFSTALKEPIPILSNLKVAHVTASSVTLSYVVKKLKKVTCTFAPEGGTAQTITHKYSEEAQEELSQKVFSFNQLVPNRKYKVSLSAEAKEENEYTAELEFTLPQDYPGFASKVELSCDDEYADSNSTFKLKVSKPSYIGYWSNNCGYDIQLFVNGIKQEGIHEVSGLADFESSLKLSDWFTSTAKTGDVLQLGAVVWTKDSDGNKLYNQNRQTAKTSNSICLITNPTQIFVNHKAE